MEKWNNFNKPNIGLLFYKRMYYDLKDLITLSGHKLTFSLNKKESEFNKYYNFLYHLKGKPYKGLFEIDQSVCKSDHRFILYTTYPGLVIGTGYDHGTSIVGDAAIGFYFDHISGLLVIPGSSIKGIIRSAFENNVDKVDEINLNTIRDLMNEITNQAHHINEIILKEFILETFGSEEKDGCDVFFDAILKLDAFDQDQTILAEDFITPHYENFYKNPTPLQFLKVKSGIPFEFRFKVKDSVKQPVFTEVVKIELFKKILLLLGVGAKTNVGYGRLDERKIAINTEINTKLEKAAATPQGNYNSGNRQHQSSNKGNQHTFPNKKKW